MFNRKHLCGAVTQGGGGLTAGDAHLPAVDVVEDVVLPAGVQFGHNVVEQRDGLLAGQRADDEAFGHFEAQSAGPLLALGAERLDRQAVELNDQVIAVRTHRRKAGKRVFPAKLYF